MKIFCLHKKSIIFHDEYQKNDVILQWCAIEMLH